LPCSIPRLNSNIDTFPLPCQNYSSTHSVADINQSLVDDGLVEKEKIGGSNYFWSFPAKKDRMMQLKYEEVLLSIETQRSKVNEAASKLADAKRGREDEGGERAKKLARLAELAAQKKTAEAELATLKENDPHALADLEKELKFVKEAANRWTDNIFACKSYLVSVELSTMYCTSHSM